MMRYGPLMALALLGSAPEPSAAASREEAILRRHDPKDYESGLRTALARFFTQDGVALPELEARSLAFEIRESPKPARPIRQMLILEITHQTATTPDGGSVITSTARRRGIAAVSSLEGRMSVDSFLSESDIKRSPQRVYEILPSVICPDVLARFDVDGVPHVPDLGEIAALARWDASVPELRRTSRVNARMVSWDWGPPSETPVVEPPAKEELGGWPMIFGADLPPLSDVEARDAASLLRAPSSYRQGIAGCVFSPAIALMFPSRKELMAVVCFQCRMIMFVRGRKAIEYRALTEPSAQDLLTIVRRVLPTLPEKLPH